MRRSLLSISLLFSMALIGMWAAPASAQNCYIDPTNLTAPADGATIDSRTPTLRATLAFSPTDGTCEYLRTYVQVSTNSSFQGNLVIDTTTQGASYPIESGVLQYNTTYYWRMAHEIRDLTDQVLVSEPYWEYFSFTTPSQTILPIDLEPDCNWPNITGHSPANEAVLFNLQPELEITAALFIPAPACEVNATQWELSDNAQFNNVHTRVLVSGDGGSATLASHHFLQNPLLPNTTYYWRVRYADEFSIDPNQVNYGPWSNTFYFYTRAENNNQPPVEDPPVDDPPVDDPPVDDPPVQQPAGNLVALDFNASCTLDDSEFFAAVDQWITEQIGNALFFEAVDAWISQSDICLTTASITYNIQITNSMGSMRFSAPSGSRLLGVIVYDLAGEVLFESQSPAQQLRWNHSSSSGALIANGVYFVRVRAIGQDGALSQRVRKIAIVR